MFYCSLPSHCCLYKTDSWVSLTEVVACNSHMCQQGLLAINEANRCERFKGPNEILGSVISGLMVDEIPF